MSAYDVVIIGAGAAGMFCAAECARRGRRTLVIEHTEKPGEKIRISGGGRCNFTNMYAGPENFLSANPQFCISALARYTQWDFVAQVEAHGIAWHEKTLGQLFCDDSAKQIIDMLLGEMRDAGAELWTGCVVDQVVQEYAFQLSTTRGAIEAEALIIATGGKSIPKIGATGFAYRIAEQFGLPLIETRPALVPFAFDPDRLAAQKPLAGVAAEVVARAGSGSFQEAILFTHRGLSGPAALQISSYWREGEEISLAFGSEAALFEQLKTARAANGRQALQTALAGEIPKALSQFLAAEIGETRHLADLSDKRLTEIAAYLADWRLKPLGTEGYRTAEVTLGGVSTEALDSRTMASRTHPNLYFIGEAVDVTGWLGGYNFQWAWSSGWAAGQVA